MSSVMALRLLIRLQWRCVVSVCVGTQNQGVSGCCHVYGTSHAFTMQDTHVGRHLGAFPMLVPR